MRGRQGRIRLQMPISRGAPISLLALALGLAGCTVADPPPFAASPVPCLAPVGAGEPRLLVRDVHFLVASQPDNTDPSTRKLSVSACFAAPPGSRLAVLSANFYLHYRDGASYALGTGNTVYNVAAREPGATFVTFLATELPSPEARHGDILPRVTVRANFRFCRDEAFRDCEPEVRDAAATATVSIDRRDYGATAAAVAR